MIPKDAILRVARPTDHLEAITKMYIEGLGYDLLGTFNGEFSGSIVGHRNHPYHLEFTSHISEKVGLAPSREHLLVFYIPDDVEYMEAVKRVTTSGFKKVEPFNPYWENDAQTFEDLDGYGVVIANYK